MLRSVGSFLASVEDIWDVGAIAVVAAFTAFIGHMVANVWMVWTVEMAEAADQGKSLMDNGVTVWSDCLFKTGFYAYDVLVWLLTFPASVILTIAMIPALIFTVKYLSILIHQSFNRVKDIANR